MTDWLQRVAGIRQYAQDGKRAPHKPLLLLYAIGRLENRDSSSVSFLEAEPSLKELLAEYGHETTRETPNYPFRRLENDGLWTVTIADGAKDPGETVTGLRATATGRLDADFEIALRDHTLRREVVAFILGEHFPPSLHDDLLAAVGLGPVGRAEVTTGERPKRDPNFRNIVLMAYENRCAFCGYDGLLSRNAVGLEAAHVQWHAFGGPDTVANALGLCSIHHKLLDRGVLGIDSDHSITVSQHFTGGSEAAARLVLALVGEEIREPQPGHPAPDAGHVEWHRDQVFNGPARVRV